MIDLAVRAVNLGKKYRIGGPQARYRTIRETLVNTAAAPVRRAADIVCGRAPSANGHDEIWALKDVSFEIGRGEVVGIIGPNGAGKSTLLKILSRITRPTEGYADIYGRVGSLLEVGTGFHPELTGRENVYLSGAVLGMQRAEIERKFDKIVDFAGVEKFIDTPVKHFSSGMYLRLAFSVAAHLEPEILLVDEVLAVGDAAFQKKCLGKMGEVAEEGRTVLFVSHNMSAVRELCKSAIWLDEGTIRARGTPSEIINAYLRNSDAALGTAVASFDEDLDKPFQLRQARLLRGGQVTQQFECDEPVTIELLCHVRTPVPDLYGYLTITRMDGTTVMESDSYDAPPNDLDNLPVGNHVLQVTVPSRTLAPGEYAVYVNFASRMNKQGFHVDSPGTLFTFGLADNSSRRGNRRRGFFSTLLRWTLLPESDVRLSKLKINEVS